jgi:hypothetical protein
MLCGGAVNADLRALRQQCIHDWLGRQEDKADTPQPGDGWVSKAEEDAGDDDEMTSISQGIHDDPPFMEIDRLAKVMNRYGWGFRFVSPDEMDVAMRKAVAGDGQNGGRGLVRASAWGGYTGSTTTQQMDTGETMLTTERTMNKNGPAG